MWTSHCRSPCRSSRTRVRGASARWCSSTPPRTRPRGLCWFVELPQRGRFAPVLESRGFPPPAKENDSRRHRILHPLQVHGLRGRLLCGCLFFFSVAVVVL